MAPIGAPTQAHFSGDVVHKSNVVKEQAKNADGVSLVPHLLVGLAVVAVPQSVVPAEAGGMRALFVVMALLLAATQLLYRHILIAAARDADAPTAPKAGQLYREEEGVTQLVDAVYHRKGRLAKKRTDITMAEVAKHSTRDDAWICVEGRAYDITKYVEHHPGGWLPIANLAGKDVSDAFANYHPARVYQKLLPSYYIGDVVDYAVSDFVTEHRAIRQKLLERGLFETRPSYYVAMWLWYASLFVGGVCLTTLRPSVAEHMLGALLMGCFWQQVAFFGHDVGHNAISHVRGLDLWWGTLVGNLTGGISLGWWKRSHNVHHIVCNSVENDPDIQHLPMFAVTEKIFGKFFSTYHQKWMTTDAAARAMVSYQHMLFYPIMAVARFNLYAQSVLLLLSGEKVDNWWLEATTLLAFYSWFSAMVWCCCGSGWEALAYLLLSHGIAGVLHVQICISHFSMDTYHGQAYNDESDEWFRMQVKTTMNVDCPWWMDWFHGGLQFQIEHHLYPRLPRHNLREARKLVKPLCEKHNIHYHEPGFFQANRELVSCMKRVALNARTLKKGDGGFYESRLWDGINAQG